MPRTSKAKQERPKELREKINIIDFCRDPNLLNLQLLDTQEVILRAMYGLPMSKEQKKLFRQMIGGPNHKLSEEEYFETVLILGRGSGKSTMVAAVACYEAACRDWNKYLRPGELAMCFVIARREQQAIDIGRNMIHNMIIHSPILRTMVVEKLDKEQESILPRSRVGVTVLTTGMGIMALPCSSKVTRGYPVGVCLLDEVGFFARESKSENTDTEIYDSLIPRMIQFIDEDNKIASKMLMISTPGDKTGLLWRKYRDREKHRQDYLCIRSPTWKMRPDFDKTFFDKVKRLSPFGYRREYGAEFLDALSPYIPRRKLEPCIRESEEEIPYNSEYLYYIGIDAAFGDRDRFGIAVGHAESIIEDGEEGYRIVIDVAEKIDELYSEDFVETAVKRIVSLCNKYNTWEVVGDQHQADAFGKLLSDKGVTFDEKTWTAKMHRDLYGQLRSLIERRLVSLPNSRELVDELLGLQIKYLSTSGQYTVSHRSAGHDDVSDSVALVVGELWEQEDEAVSLSWI